jgi:hypothetical protein
MNNEAKPLGEKQIQPHRLMPRVWPISSGPSCIFFFSFSLFFCRDKWSLCRISHTEVGWHRDLFLCILFSSVRGKNCFPPFQCRRGRFLIKKDTLCVLRYKWYFAERRINTPFTEGERKMILACRISGRPSAIVVGDWTASSSVPRDLTNGVARAKQCSVERRRTAQSFLIVLTLCHTGMSAMIHTWVI